MESVIVTPVVYDLQNPTNPLLSLEKSTYIILIITIIVIILFTILTIAFVFYPISKAVTNANNILLESKEGVRILDQTTADAENTLQILDSAAVRTSQVEDTIFGFIGAFCTVFPFNLLTFCKNYNH